MIERVLKDLKSDQVELLLRSLASDKSNREICRRFDLSIVEVSWLRDNLDLCVQHFFALKHTEFVYHREVFWAA